MKRRYLLLLVAFWLVPARRAHALAVSNVTFSDTNITYETGGIPNGTTISFTIDQAGLVQIAVNCGIQNFGDAGTNVANLTQNYAGSGTNQIFWNGLWLINGQLGRNATTCDFSLTLSSNGTTSTAATPSTLVTLNSVDIHSLSVTPSIDASGAETAPYAISYALAKSAKVSMVITNSSGTIVRTLLSNASQAPETTISTHTVSWNGLADSGQPVPLSAYTLTVTATDPSIAGSSAIPRTASIPVQSLSGTAGDPQKLFENSVFVFPNPVRNGQGTFQMEAVRDGSNLSLKIYTITGTLVFEQSFPGVPTGNTMTFPWSVTNQSGNKVGRGLYYYVVREDDSTGTLQTVKKMAVLP